MQAALNPALAQVIGAMDVISPVTPDGKPTVAAQVMQAAKQATMPQIAQQAGLGGQIQAMKMQEAQKSLMNAAMQQQGSPGIEGLNPQMGSFAEGGIVGYAEAGEAKDKPLSERYQGMGLLEALRAMYSDISSALPSLPDSAYRDTSERSQRLAVEREAARRSAQEMPAAPREVPQAAPAREQIPSQDPSEAALIAAMLEGGGTPQPQAPRAQAALPQADYSLEGRNYPAPIRTIERFPNVPAARPAGVPSAPVAARPQGPAAPTSAGLFDRAQGRLDQYATEPVTPRSAIQPALEAGAASDEYRRQMGLPTEMERIAQQEAQFKSLFGDREKLIQRRLAEIEGQKQMGGIAAFMKGFRQMKGEPIGPGFVRASDSMGAYDTTMRQRTEKLEDLKIELQGLSIERQNALDKMRDDIANGRFSDALKRKDAAQKATNDILLKRAEIDMAQAKVVGGMEEARFKASQPSPEQQRINEMTQMYLRVLSKGQTPTDEQRIEATRMALQDVRGAGQAGGRDIQMQKLANEDLTKYKMTVEYLTAKTPEQKAALLANKKKELRMQYPGAVFAEEESAAPTGAPKPGTVMDGYRFKGGNPADQKNWEKV